MKGKVSLPFSFLSRGKTSYVRDKEFLWEVFEKTTFKVMASSFCFYGTAESEITL